MRHMRRRYWTEGDAEMAWRDMDRRYCWGQQERCAESLKGGKECGKQARWWNNEVKSAVRWKKVMYIRLLEEAILVIRRS